MLIFRCILVLWVFYSNIFTCFNVQKTLYLSHTGCAAYRPFHPLSETLFLSSCYPAPKCPVCSDWSAGPLCCDWSTESNSSDSRCAKLAARQVLCKCVTWWHHHITDEKAGLQARHFRQFRSSVWTLGFVTSQTFYIHKKLYNKLKERGNAQKHNGSSLNTIYFSCV